MSGHSKWSTIKRAKGVADSKRSALFGKLAKRISVAIWETGNADQNTNSRLRTEIQRAKDARLPNDNIERAIKSALGKKDAQIKEVIYEGYGPYGVALLIEGATNNNNRTVQEIKHILNKVGGNLGPQGSTAWQFKEQAEIIIEPGNQKENLELTAIDSGAQNIYTHNDFLIIECAADKLNQILEEVKKYHANIVQAEVVKKNSSPIILSQEQSKVIEKLISDLENNDDVISVYSSLTK